MIAFFVPNIYPCWVGGMEIFYHHLINEYSQKEKIIVITNCSKVKSKKFKRIPVSTRLFLLQRFNLGTISLFITTFLGLLIHRKSISVLHVPTTSGSVLYGFFFPIIKKILKIPYIIQFHSGEMRPWQRNDGNYQLFKNADNIIAVSETIKIEYEKRTNRHIDVVLPLTPYKSSSIPKDELKKNYGYNKDDYVIIMVGSIKALKNNFWVYNDFKNYGKEKLIKEKKHLLFVGKGKEFNKLKETIQNDKMNDLVKAFGGVSNDKIHEIFGLADLYIIASDYEGTSKSLLEAMYNSLPIIGTNVNGINSIIENRQNGLLVEKNVSGALTLAIKELSENKVLALKFGKNAKRTYLDKYSFETTLEKLKRIYNLYI